MTRKLPIDIQPMSHCCGTCPFKTVNGREQDVELAHTVKQRMLKGASQLCHSTKGGKPGEKICSDTRLCRGGRDFLLQYFHRIGFLEEPTDVAWDAKRDELNCKPSKPE